MVWIGVKNPAKWEDLEITYSADIKATRGNNTAYLAATNLNIYVYVMRAAADGNGVLQAGTTTDCNNAYLDLAYYDAAHQSIFLQGWVPAGWYYKINCSNSPTIVAWYEVD